MQNKVKHKEFSWIFSVLKLFCDLYSVVAKSISTSSYIVTTMVKPVQMRMTGYEAVEKTAVRGGNSGRIYVPKSWIGKKVRAVRIE